MPSDTENDSAEMARPRPTLKPKPGTPPRKPTIFQSNASNPDFVPGYSVLRVEQVKHMSNSRDKTRLMNSIVDDIVASVSSINEYHRNGILSDDNIFQVSTMMQCMGQNNLKMQDRLEDMITRLKRQNTQKHQNYMELAQSMDVMGQMYANKVDWLEQQVRVLKERVASVEAQGRPFQSQKQLDDRIEHYSRYLEEKAQKEFDERAERVNRYCEEMRKNRGYDGQEQMVQDEDNADGEWEEDNIKEDGLMKGL
ncbi:uncharacterized protein N7473_001956 [Penicillium subrubescens]|jgi:hypothetical protein|uniref:Uncharacterized protein n=1 Tax=Penicillium subrubescens TaxID=1316194 RepID=A0A1Q5SQN7_9EURO|nr:uncharacterized protein N7473_001956 [Penicillium subrubescens]KAJ5905040.1 hypothetical protein N7473_001956 [Penicillium subrubescens]OKO90309.1 hypothetical protein PENSUB_13442 [Penicillium subrubescens]